jgi:putative FmdB family regulatory protein
MPLYEYECLACGHRFEVIRKFSDTPLSECPKCGGVVEKLISSPAIQFKGSGFYLTDYGRGGKSDTAPGQSAKSEANEKSGKSTKSDKGEAAPSSGSSGTTGSTGETSSAKAGDSKPAAAATPKSDS